MCNGTKVLHKIRAKVLRVISEVIIAHAMANERKRNMIHGRKGLALLILSGIILTSCDGSEASSGAQGEVSAFPEDFHWSLIDNFEWISGYSMRFCLYSVNFETFERRPTGAVEAYRNSIQDQRITTEIRGKYAWP